MKTADLTGQDLAYWVARANTAGSAQERNVLRRHYGSGKPTHEPVDEQSMLVFVVANFGLELPPVDLWQ